MKIGVDLDGVCKCGCGETPNRASRSYRRANGVVIPKGGFYLYCPGHQHRGWRWYKEPAPVEIEPTDQDKAWAAGFYEGEGSIIASKRTFRITLPQKNIEPLKWLQQRWAGGLYGPTPSKDLTVWYLSGANARRFMADIYPMLSTRRREQAQAAGWEGA